MAARVGTTAPKPASNKMVDTTHLRLLAGETEAFSASEKGGWPWAKSEVRASLLNVGQLVGKLKVSSC
jgi:hypothetical protein